ncbi:MAG: hypothetical protein KFKLKKLM_01148 [Flavobacteriales bacterium]|nr:MAG: hypothetical protein F9K09_00880 [Flavobacteriales bacterium]MBV6484638.1 hypothetical protein [Flavobacteriales bacterium]
MKYFIIYIFSIALLVGCASSSKKYDKGDYDSAMEISAKKIKKDPGKFEEVDVFNDAYRMAYVKDKAEVERLKAEGNPANWSKIYTIYVRMNRRQELAKTLPPVGIVYEEQDFESEIENAKTKATEYAYAKGVEQLGKNDKLAAREAYSRFVEAKSYITNFRDVDEKIAEAKFKGTTNVFFTIEDKSKVVAPKALMEELQAINVDDLDKDWLNYDNTIDSNRIYHYSIILSMTDILVSPEEMKESIAQESKEIEDGFSYVLDANGNVKKDTLGNDIKIPKYKTIHCAIKRVQQRKTARITGSLNYYDNITNKLMKSEPITSDALFENFYAVANGDLNALSPQSQKDLQTQPVPFPPSPDLIIQAGNVLKGMTKDIIVKNAGYLK